MYRPCAVHEDVQRACNILANEVSLEDNDLGNSASLAQQSFSKSHAASIVTMKKNGWKPTQPAILDDVHKACVKHGHWGLWNTMEYTLQDVVCIPLVMISRQFPRQGPLHASNGLGILATT